MPRTRQISETRIAVTRSGAKYLSAIENAREKRIFAPCASSSSMIAPGPCDHPAKSAMPIAATGIRAQLTTESTKERVRIESADLRPVRTQKTPNQNAAGRLRQPR